MKQLILIMLLGAIGKCHAGTYDMDTIDNWQIYNGADLVLAAHDSQLAAVAQGTIKRVELKDLSIQYNCDVVGDFDVIVEILDDQGNTLLSGNYKAGHGIRFAFRKDDSHD